MEDVDTQAAQGRWVIVALLSVAFTINYMDRQVIFAIFPLLGREMSFTDTQLGLAGSLFTWTYSAAMPFAGRLADVWPKNRLIVASLILWSAATIASGLSRDVTEFLISRVAMGLSESLYSPAAMALITQVHSNKTRSRALSIHGFAQFTGITLGGWYGGWAAETFGWRTGLVALAIVGILYSVVLAKFLRDRKEKAVIAEQATSTPLELVRSSAFWVISITFFAFCAMLWMLYAWLPTHIYETYKLSLADSGLMATLFLQSSSAIGVLAGGTLGDYFGKKNPISRFRVLSFGLFIAAPFAFATFAAPSLLLLKLSACGFGLFAGLFIANMFSSVYDIVAKWNYGLAVGVINMIGGLGAGSAILLAGMFKKSIPVSSLMLWGTSLSMIMAVVLAFTIHLNFQKHAARKSHMAGHLPA